MGEESDCYLATFDSQRGEFGINVKFVKPVRGVSDTGNLSLVEGWSLSLSRTEALRIGTMLLEAAQRPTDWSDALKWMPPEAMPCLDVSGWNETVKIECLGYEMDYKITNESNFHLGMVTIECKFTKGGEEELRRGEVKLLIDLPARQSTRFTIENSELVRGARIKDVSIIAVTGAVL